MPNNDKLNVDLNRYKDEVNSVRYCIGNIEKSHKELVDDIKELKDKMDKILEKDDKNDVSIEEGKKFDRIMEILNKKWE